MAYSFQVDDQLIKDQRVENDNYIIEYNSSNSYDNTCVLYFSSNDIYYPNEADAFSGSILKRDYYEWRTARHRRAYKHIFIRDTNKQWYLNGINDKINNQYVLLKFLRSETNGMNVITIGSSAGGYAAILYGILLDASQVFAFNPQIEIVSLLETNEARNPLVFRYANDKALNRYFDLTEIICEKRRNHINYFVSINSEWDKKQLAHLKETGAYDNINIIKFNSSHHGIPFPKVALDSVIHSDQDRLIVDKNNVYNPITYSVTRIGIIKTILGLVEQIYRTVIKQIKRKML